MQRKYREISFILVDKLSLAFVCPIVAGQRSVVGLCLCLRNQNTVCQKDYRKIFLLFTKIHNV